MADEKPWHFAPSNYGSGQPMYDPSRCAKCGTAGPTEKYVGEGGVIGLTHGGYQYWCALCLVRGQIAYALEQKARLPELYLRLSELVDE